MSKRLICTGASGYLGSSLLIELERQAIFDEITATFYRNPKSIEAPGIRFISLSELFRDQLNFESVDVICHLGAPRGRKYSEFRLQDSLTELKFLLSRVCAARVPKVLYASSQAVYGMSPPPWHENAPLNPATEFGRMKAKAERVVESFCSLSSSTSSISLRLPKLVGPGEGFRMDQGEWIHFLVYAAIMRKPISFTRQFMETQFDFMDVRDASLVIAEILTKSPSEWPKVLNVGNGRFVSGGQLLSMVDHYSKELLGCPLKCSILEPREKTFTRNFGMNVSALHAFTDLRGRALENTIVDTFNFLMNIDPVHLKEIGQSLNRLDNT